ncbi:venom allergen 3 homolog isoform X3 [Leptopilina heterotoma]|uniref:venom allergen 3 homolog isoform X3 n=1 Tax=Leptopilina heterotoma TaxID=63436 RepID=UPI001CAA0CB1|nr:venom allergen 3 homolog isoform X3 [Leptopilina heterotoma]
MVNANVLSNLPRSYNVQISRPTIQPHLTLEQVQEILEVHNNLRRNVAAGGESQGNPGPQPPAISIPDLVWDYELANIAQRWANHCFFDQKDQCRNVVRFKVGQNVATAGTGADQIPTNIMTTLVNEMYSEVMYFDSRQVENVTDFTKVGRYTQMMWSTTTNIGCGYVSYRLGPIFKRLFLVCNYGPAGNIPNGKVYDIRR